MMEYITNWETISTNAGAITAVLLLTQITKNIPGIQKLPTQLWSFILSFAVLLAAAYFTSGLDASSIGLIIFNAIIVSLATNGGYEIFSRSADAYTDEELDYDGE
jgi:hypothetical protein